MAPNPIQLFTDYLSLCSIQNKDLYKVNSSREIRMLEKMFPYNYQVNHINACKNIVADALSRNPTEHYDFTDILGDEYTHKINYKVQLEQTGLILP